MKSTTTVSIGLFLLAVALVANCAIAARIRGASRDDSHQEITAPNHENSRRLRRENPKQYYYRRYLKKEKESSSPSPLPTKGLPEVASRLEEKSSSPSPLPTKGVISSGSTSSDTVADKLDKMDKADEEDKFEEDVVDKEEKEDEDSMEVSFDDEFEMEGNTTEIVGTAYETTGNTTGTNTTTTVDEETAAFGFFTRIGSRTNPRFESNSNANILVSKLTRGIGQLPSQAKIAVKSTKADKKSKSGEHKRSKRSKDDSSPNKSENKLIKAR